MKTQKVLNKVLIVLIVVLLSVVSFGGIYYKDKGQMVSRIPGYTLDADLGGYRQVTLNVDDSDDEHDHTHEEDTTTEGNNTALENTSSAEENTVAENETANNTAEEKKEYTADDYKKTAETMKKRLKSLGVQNYQLLLDENTGKILLRLPENSQTDIILSDINEIGKFSIKDSETNEELLNNSDVRSVNVSLRATEYSNTNAIVMTINFNTKGARKFKQVTSDYQNVANEILENTGADETNTVNNETNTSSENATNETNTTTGTSTENKKKEVKISIESSDMLTTNFDEIIDNGTLSLTIGAAQEEFETQMFSALNLAAIIENDPIDVTYSIVGNTYVDAAIEDNTLKAIVYIETAIALVILLIMVIKYRVSGILRAIISVGFIAGLLLVIRYTNVALSLEGIFAIELGFIINVIYNFMILKAEKEGKLEGKEKNNTFKKIMKSYTLILVPILIIALVYCFTQWAGMLSIGMVLFWSILISWVYNTLLNKFLV